MPDSESRSGDVFDVERIRSLLELMEEFDLREVDLKQADQRIRLARGTEPVPPSNSSAQPSGNSASAAPPSAAAAAPPPTAGSGATEADPAHIAHIKSPMVGTYYGRPNPNAEPYVRVGDHVESETTVCIIEAMKVFNEIPAEVRGRIVAVMLDDEEPVEYGKLLFKVDTSV